LKDRRWERLRLLIGLVVAGGSLWLGLRGLDWQDFSGALAHVKWPWLVLAWLTIPVGTSVKALRWKCLLPSSNSQPRWLRLLAILATGQLVNAVIPTRLGEVTRAYLASRASENTFALTLGTLVVEKALDGLALLSLTAVLALNIALPGWFGTAALSFGALFALLFLILFVVTFQRQRLLRWSTELPQRLQRTASTGLDGLGVLRQRGVFLPAAFSTMLVWTLGFATNYSLFIALGIEPTALGCLLIIVVHYLAVLIPGVPGQVGLFHYTTVLALGVFGIPRELSMPYAVVLHALIYGTILVLGAISVSWLSLDLGALMEQLRALARKRRSTQ